MINPSNYEEVKDIIMNLKPKKLFCFLWNLFENSYILQRPVINAVASIFNQSFREGSFPSALKLCKVYPLLKDGGSKKQATTDLSLLSPKCVKKLCSEKLENTVP